jgi:hypothetical protein
MIELEMFDFTVIYVGVGGLQGCIVYVLRITQLYHLIHRIARSYGDISEDELSVVETDYEALGRGWTVFKGLNKKWVRSIIRGRHSEDEKDKTHF